MGFFPDSYHWLLWHSGAGTVNRSHRQQLSKDPEWCWMETGPAVALPFPDPSATVGSHLLSDGSCPTCSVFHRTPINFVVTFWTTPLRTWKSLTSNARIIYSSGTVFPFTDHLSTSSRKVPAKTEVE